MKKIIIIMMFLSLVLLVSCKQDVIDDNNDKIKLITDSNLDDNYVKWEGRYEVNDKTDKLPKRVSLYHTATGFTIKFYGTKLIVDFYAELADKGNRNVYYNFSLDEEVLPNPSENRTFSLNNGFNSITLVTGLTNGVHSITCLKMSETYDAYTAIYNFETDGYFIKRDIEDDNARFRFMYVCASGGSGFGSLAYGNGKNNPVRTTSNSSSLHSFNFLTARMFDADSMYVSTSGWGVYYPKSIANVMNYTGITTANSVESAKTTSLWNYDKWIPDVIIFNIGGNDTTQTNFDQIVYQEETVKMVKNLHEKFPKAKMIWTHTGSKAGQYAVSAMTDSKIMSEGYMTVALIPKVGEGETGIGTYGASNHNSIKTHIDAANILADILINLKYSKIIENIAFNDFENILKKY